MKIHVLTVQGSPRGIIPEDLHNSRGVGGAEKSLLELFGRLAKRGYDVTIYNDPRELVDDGNLHFRNFEHFDFEERDRILFTFRGPHFFTRTAKRIKHIGWSCDQYTMGEYRDWYNEIDKMILISNYHLQDHLHRYSLTKKDLEKIKITDLGVDYGEYSDTPEKNPHQVLYCSQPDRGLDYLADYWNEINERLPELRLYIFGGFSLWNGYDDLDLQFRARWIGKKNVVYRGKVPRAELVEFQKKSEAQLYPCSYFELFNISTAECLSAGTYAITSSIGAVDTTNFSEGKVLGNPQHTNFRKNFIDKVVEFFSLPIEERRRKQAEIKKRALERFDWDVICDKWEKEILNF